ncbi:hypothetical protein FA10DRAFT_265697 [Acaromyces ingoldii]|uniref:Uncharacterized protein n=1 Tax=Acaromyces ingoldii TaxID=215250 RepID=A0A316YS70_9BASI|nr:hypothetical protein FA10DRAFT_265697 [Acaromyces ingoldii]PWN91866.1 hypothetical protein FA10DRAFT_265697 [Acaromyces ingoldii]
MKGRHVLLATLLLGGTSSLASQGLLLNSPTWADSLPLHQPSHDWSLSSSSSSSAHYSSVVAAGEGARRFKGHKTRLQTQRDVEKGNKAAYFEGQQEDLGPHFRKARGRSEERKGLLVGMRTSARETELPGSSQRRLLKRAITSDDSDDNEIETKILEERSRRRKNLITKHSLLKDDGPSKYAQDPVPHVLEGDGVGRRSPGGDDEAVP